MALYLDSPKPEITVEANDLELDIDTAVPLGLIANELMTNASKYVFPAAENPVLLLRLEELGNGQYQLTATDNGPGLPDGFDASKAKSLGLRLVNRLSDQLFGEVAYRNDNGAVIEVRFKDTAARKEED